jgi:lysophospholipase L1-like esterase
MVSVLKRKLVYATLIGLVACVLPPGKKITLWMIGDSTMSIKEIKNYPETGWGMPFAYFFDSSVVVKDLAKNGRSTRTFRDEGLWQPALDNMQPGDYVFIQFGHNDEVPTKASATTPEQFKANLERYVAETRNKKGLPFLLTPVARRNFNAAGKIEGTHDAYSAIVRTVAKENNVPLIDMDVKSQELLQQLGPGSSKLLYNWLEPGEHPNYPGGVQDNTHLGARKMAELVLKEIKTIDTMLASHIVKSNRLPPPQK